VCVWGGGVGGGGCNTWIVYAIVHAYHNGTTQPTWIAAARHAATRRPASPHAQTRMNAWPN
jgi:hypothetical protein